MLAAALALGGYTLLLSARRGPLPTAEAPDVTAPVPPQAPQRLPNRPNFEPASAPAFAGVEPAATATLRARITGPSAVDAALGAGLAVLDAKTNARLRWLPLASAEADGGALRVTAEVPATPLRLTVAPAEHAAARGWWIARDVAPADLAGELALATPLQDIALHVTHGGAPRGTPYTLRRDGEPAWRDRAPAPRQPDERGTLWLRLAPGTYRLAPLPLPAGVEPFAFTVPGAGVFAADFSVAAGRDGRP